MPFIRTELILELKSSLQNNWSNICTLQNKARSHWASSWQNWGGSAAISQSHTRSTALSYLILYNFQDWKVEGVESCILLLINSIFLMIFYTPAWINDYVFTTSTTFIGGGTYPGIRRWDSDLKLLTNQWERAVKEKKKKIKGKSIWVTKLTKPVNNATSWLWEKPPSYTSHKSGFLGNLQGKSTIAL